MACRTSCGTCARSSRHARRSRGDPHRATPVAPRQPAASPAAPATQQALRRAHRRSTAPSPAAPAHPPRSSQWLQGYDAAFVAQGPHPPCRLLPPGGHRLRRCRRQHRLGQLSRHASRSRAQELRAARIRPLNIRCTCSASTRRYVTSEFFLKAQTTAGRSISRARNARARSTPMGRGRSAINRWRSTHDQSNSGSKSRPRRHEST